MVEKDNADERISYWIQRMKEDSALLDESRRKGLLTSLLRDYVELTERETELFFMPSPLNSSHPTETQLGYLEAERKVANFFASEYEEEDSPLRKAYLESFRDVLVGFYSEEELDEMFSFLYPDPRGDTLVLFWLVGRSHYICRRIRNAYLPLITDFLEVGPNGVKEIVLFDDGEEPVDTIDRLFGGKE